MHRSIPPVPGRQRSAADPAVRGFWRLLERLPDGLGHVDHWRAVAEDPWPGQGHLHAVPTVVACLSGVVCIERSGARAMLSAGDVLVIAPGVWHQHVELRAGAAWFGLGLMLSSADIVLGDASTAWTGRIPAQPTERLLEAALASTQADERRETASMLMRHILAEATSDLVVANPAVERMLAALHRGLCSGIGAQALLHASGLSRAQASRIFRDHWGDSAKNVLGALRLRLADALLTSGCRAATAAQRAGFSSVRALQRARKASEEAPVPASTRRR